jgi:hypothetical protein
MHPIPFSIRCAISVFAAVLATANASTAQTRKEFRFATGPGTSISVINEFGRVSIQPSATAHVSVIALLNSEKANIEVSQKGNRVEFRTRLSGRPEGKDARVEYHVQVPIDANVTIRSADGPLQVEGLQGDLTVEGEAATVEIANAANAHVHVHTVNGPITLTNVKNAYVEVTSVTGSISMTDVSGPKIAASTGSGKLHFAGDCAGGGTYSLTNHAGDTEVILPTSASVDVSARSLKGRVLNQFPFQSNHKDTASSANANTGSSGPNALTLDDGRAFMGTSNSGASSIRVNSLSGTITVRKQ